MTGEPPEHAIDWKGNDWTPESDEPAAHPNARFTTPAAQCPSIAPEWEDPAGVPIDAFLFGGRRATVVPLVSEAFDWEHGVFLGATMSVGDDGRRGGRGRQAALRPDGDAAVLRLQHGRLLRALAQARPRATRTSCRRIFVVNWFRKDEDGKFLWPGFGENSRVLEWVFRRCDGEGETVETPIGLVPAEGELEPRRRSTSPTRRCASCSPSTPTAFATSCRRSRSSSPSSATGCPARSARQLEALEAAARLDIAYLR